MRLVGNPKSCDRSSRGCVIDALTRAFSGTREVRRLGDLVRSVDDDGFGAIYKVL